jgi:hypothetical protein
VSTLDAFPTSAKRTSALTSEQTDGRAPRGDHRPLEHAGRFDVDQALREGYRCQLRPFAHVATGGTLTPAGG